ANTGTSYRVLARTASITAAAADGSQANTCPRSATFGQEMFTSTAVTPAAAESRVASSAYSPTVLPAIDTTARAPRDSSQGRSRCRNASMPGPCRPIEFSMPLAVSAIRGVGRPAWGTSWTDLVTTAPIRDTSRNWASSRPEPAQPDAVRTGLGSSVSPSRVRRSTAMGPPSARGGGPRAAGTAGRTGTARGGRPARTADGPRLPARRAERVERDRADVVPADLLAAEHRPVRAGPHHPGDPVAAHHRQHAGHADPDAAGHGLFHGGQHGQVPAPGQHRDLAQHRHWPAGVDHVGARLLDDLAQQIGDKAARAQRPVLGGDRRGPPGAPRGQRAEHPVPAGRAEQE